jgi:F0F1-type ATP synthase membrane subunit c/vacuolar-type H+-ATPase subunit K
MKQSALSVVVLLAYLLNVTPVFGQALSTGIASKVPIDDTELFDGAVICSTEQGFLPCNTPYATNMFGVYTKTPAAFFEVVKDEPGQPVVSQGIVTVRATALNGSVNLGDYLTASEVRGIAMKATENGYVLGTAMDPLEPDLNGEGMVRVALNIHAEAKLSTNRTNLLAMIRDASKAPVLDSLSAWRYLIAALMVLLSFLMAFLYFGRMSKVGVEAIGRNPLAEKAIRASVFLHIMVTLVIVGAGLATAYLVLIL